MLSAQYIDGAKGRIFLVARGPLRKAKRRILIVPPFAEEMNKTRPMLTAVAIALASQDTLTILPDMYGTGDSAGEFSDADWTCWCDDLRAVIRWCERESGSITDLFAIRLGCALALSAFATHAIPAVEGAVLWQPLFDGKRALTQFLRLRLAAEMTKEGGNQTDLRRRLNEENLLEVAGYQISRRLADDVEQLKAPAALPKEFGAIQWMEIIPRDDAPVPQPTMNLIEATRQQAAVSLSAFVGEPFWSATEIVRNQALIDATVAAFVGNLR